MNGIAERLIMSSTRRVSMPINIQPFQSLRQRGLFIVSPHAEYPDDFFIGKHLIYKTMLYVDPSRIGSSQVAHKLFIRRGILKRICFKYRDQSLHLVLQT